MHHIPGRVSRLLGALWLTCVLTGGKAQAQDLTLIIQATYGQLVEDALRAYQARAFDRAEVLFRQAHQLSPNARTLRGLGKVAFELGRYREAIDYLERAEQCRTQPLDSAMYRDAELLLARARKRLTLL